MRKKILSLALALAMCLGLMAVPAAALNPGEEWVGDFVVNGDTLVKYYGEDSVVAIPSNITKIEREAFKNCTSVTSVTIPSGVTEIGTEAFQGCTGLTSVTIPSGVAEIEASTFEGCTGLKSVNISSGVKGISSYAFRGCTSLTSVTIPSSVKEIWTYVFSGCTSLTDVTILPGVTKIGTGAFENCTSLTSITIPSGITRLEAAMFRGCTSLANVNLPSGIQFVDGFVFQDCTSLTSVTIPSGVTHLQGTYTFMNCTRLTSVTLPASIESIKYDVFQNCTSLTDIYFGGSKAQWNANSGEKALTYAKINPTVHFNSTGPSTQPTTPTQPDKPAGKVAYASTQAVLVDGKKVEFQMYALKDANGNGTNYIKLRDMAYVLNGTKAQFAVGYDGTISLTTGQAYAAAGGEMTTPFSGDRTYSDGTQSVKVNGKPVEMTAITLLDDAGGGYNYFKLRDLGKALGFNVGWSKEAGVFIESDKPYAE